MRKLVHCFREVSRVKLSISLFSVITTLYMSEFLLIIFQPMLFRTPDMAGYDNRSVIEIIDEDRQAGVMAYPSANPRIMMEDPLTINGKTVIPLGGATEAKTIVCNEWGKFFSYTSDKYGFNNSSSDWDSVDLALVGDSYTQGYCMPDEKHFAGIIRSKHRNVLNLGMSGNGPLVQLATIREYLEPLAPGKVVWLYFEGNDIEDLTREMKDPVTSQYLKSRTFTQELRKNSLAIDKALKIYLERRIEKERQKKNQSYFASVSDLKRRFWEWVKLYNLRARLHLANFKEGWVLDEYDFSVSFEDVKSAYDEILAEVAERVSGWDGKLYFVYLPGWEQFGRYEGYNEHPFKSHVLETARRLNIPVLDLSDAFRKQENPLKLFPFETNLHYNHEGNQLVAEKVLQFINADDLSHAGVQSK